MSAARALRPSPGTGLRAGILALVLLSSGLQDECSRWASSSARTTKNCSSRWSRSWSPWRAGWRQPARGCWCCSRGAIRPARAARSMPSPSQLNPRQCRIVALAKPSEREQGQWYFQRYVAHLPAAGEIVLFDRSWYNRAGVEKVMGFASEDQVAAFLDAGPDVREAAGRRRHPAVQILAVLRPGRAGGALCRTAGRSAEALEALADRSRRAREIRRLHHGARGHAQGHPHAGTRPGPWSTSTTRSAGG